jgi:hypothetical protein
MHTAGLTTRQTRRLPSAAKRREKRRYESTKRGNGIALNTIVRKAKAVPQHAYGGAGVEMGYSSYSFTTSALVGVNYQCHTPDAINPGEMTPVPIGQEAGRAPEPVWKPSLEENPFASAGDRTSIAP